ASRYCEDEQRVPDPLRDARGFVQALEERARTTGARVLLPVTEASLLAVLGERARFSGICVPFPEEPVFRAACDKARVLAPARQVGIAGPEQRILARPEDAAALDPDSLRYPLVVKPARSVAESGHGRLKLGVAFARDEGELRQRLAQLPAAAFPVLLQQRIIGPGVGIFLLLWDGRTDAVFSHRRIREKPPAGGVSVYRESIPADPGLVRASAALLADFGWRGVAM